MRQLRRVSNIWLRLYRRVLRWGHAAATATLDADAPLRLQLLSAEQMELHGKALARAHRVHPRPRPDLLLKRLKENEILLDHASALLTRMVQDEIRVTPLGKWRRAVRICSCTR